MITAERRAWAGRALVQSTLLPRVGVLVAERAAAAHWAAVRRPVTGLRQAAEILLGRVQVGHWNTATFKFFKTTF